jgi:hypothetical protein
MYPPGTGEAGTLIEGRIMSDHATNLDHLSDLVGAICDKAASPEELIELDSIVRMDGVARDWYLDYCQLHSALRLELRAHLATQAVCQRITIKSDTTELSGLAAVKIGPAGSLVSGFPTTPFQSSVGFFSSGWPMAYLVATVIVGLGIAIAGVVCVSPPTDIAGHPQPTIAQQRTVVQKAEIVGRITGMVDCKWDDFHERAIHGDHVRLGKRYSLNSGLMEITYDTGAKVILQGPATFEVDSASGGYLSIGRLTARLEESAKRGVRSTEPVVSGQWPVAGGDALPQRKRGPNVSHSPNPQSLIPNPLFSITTPTAIVTDLGTEFAVEVNKASKTTLHVFCGKVQMAAIHTSGSVTAQQLVLGQNESAYVQNADGQAVKIPTQASQTAQFVRSFSTQKAQDAESDAYGAMVLAMRPVVYYRMEPAKQGNSNSLVDSAPGKHHGVIHFAGGYVASTSYAQGRFGQSLRLRGPQLCDYAMVSDYPKSDTGRLTVSAWVLAMGRGTPSIIASNWIVFSKRDSYHEGQFVLYSSYHTSGNLAGRISDRDGREVILQTGKTWDSAFPLGVWQHVAQVFDGSEMSLYRNGVKESSCPCTGLLAHPTRKSLLVGCEARDETDMMGYWQGRIDELAIFNRDLSALEIRRLADGVEPDGVAKDPAERNVKTMHYRSLQSQ